MVGIQVIGCKRSILVKVSCSYSLGEIPKTKLNLSKEWDRFQNGFLSFSYNVFAYETSGVHS